jgi:hypothetical protein
MAGTLITRPWGDLTTNDRRWLFLVLDGKLMEFAYARSLRLGCFTFWRSLDDQKRLVSEGKSSTLRSYHRTWRAKDFFVLGDNGKPIWSVPAPPAESPYLELGVYWESLHPFCRWGGRWTKPFDPYHFQLGQ